MYGQLGDWSQEADGRTYYKSVFFGAKAVAAGTRHSMVLADDGSVWTTGYNMHGELGDGSAIDKASFLRVITYGAKAIAAGGYHSMVINKDGSILATGSNEFGQIGDGSTNSRNTFVRVAETINGVLRHAVPIIPVDTSTTARASTIDSEVTGQLRGAYPLHGNVLIRLICCL